VPWRIGIPPTTLMYEWAAGGDAIELRRQMVTGNRLLLIGAVSAEGARQLDAWQMSEIAA